MLASIQSVDVTPPCFGLALTLAGLPAASRTAARPDPRLRSGVGRKHRPAKRLFLYPALEQICAKTSQSPQDSCQRSLLKRRKFSIVSRPNEWRIHG
jgi:hypothetical protein